MRLLFTLKWFQAQCPKLQIGNTEISHKGATPSSSAPCRAKWRRLSRTVSRWVSNVSKEEVSQLLWAFASLSDHLHSNLYWVRIPQVSCCVFHSAPPRRKSLPDLAWRWAHLQLLISQLLVVLMGLFHSWCGTLPLLNFMRFLSAHFSSLCTYKITQEPDILFTIPSIPPSAKLLRVHSRPSFSLLIKVLNVLATGICLWGIITSNWQSVPISYFRSLCFKPHGPAKFLPILSSPHFTHLSKGCYGNTMSKMC